MEKTVGELATEASAARSMLDNDVFNVCFEKLNTHIVEQLLATQLDESDERERLFMMFKGGQTFVQQFVGLINNYELTSDDKVDN